MNTTDTPRRPFRRPLEIGDEVKAKRGDFLLPGTIAEITFAGNSAGMVRKMYRVDHGHATGRVYRGADIFLPETTTADFKKSSA